MQSFPNLSRLRRRVVQLPFSDAMDDADFAVVAAKLAVVAKRLGV